MLGGLRGGLRRLTLTCNRYICKPFPAAALHIFGWLGMGCGSSLCLVSRILCLDVVGWFYGGTLNNILWLLCSNDGLSSNIKDNECLENRREAGGLYQIRGGYAFIKDNLLQLVFLILSTSPIPLRSFEKPLRSYLQLRCLHKFFLCLNSSWINMQIQRSIRWIAVDCSLVDQVQALDLGSFFLPFHTDVGT